MNEENVDEIEEEEEEEVEEIEDEDSESGSEDESKDESEDESEDDSEKPEEDSSDEEEKPKKPSRRSRRIQSLVAERNYYREQVDSLMAERAALMAQAEDPAPPRMSDYDTEEEYQRALYRYDADMIARNRSVEAQVRSIDARIDHATREENESLKSSFATRQAEFARETPDYNEVLERAKDLPINPIAAKAIIESDNGPGVQYYVAKNRAAYDRLMSLRTPEQVYMEVGRLNAIVNSRKFKKPKPKKTTTGAPKPISRPRGTARAESLESLYMKEDITEWVKRVRARNSKK